MLFVVGFWLCVGLVIYIYVGYPSISFLLAATIGRNVRKEDIKPEVTVVISAFNEELEIAHTVENKLSQDYPSDRLKVIVISDGSTDRTDEIVRSLDSVSEGRIKLLRQEPRQGKTQALNMAAAHAQGDVLVFADGNSIYARDAISQLVRGFADPSVGYVTGQMVYTNPDGSGIGEGSKTYMKYENWVRIMETRLGSIVGVDGGIDAIRRSLYAPMHSDQLPDFVLPLSVVEKGSRVVYEPAALLYERALSAASDEFQMRVRVSLRALWSLYDKRKLFNPIRFPLFAWQLLSHKALRYGAFIPIAGLLIFNIALIDTDNFYFGFLALQLLAYVFAALGHFTRTSKQLPTMLFAPYYFVVLNAACAVAFWKFLRGQKMVLWKPRGGA